jgi:hypothetical protein
MDSLPTWAWWMVAGGILLSPVFAFLVAVVVEIFIGLLSEGGVPAVIALLCAGISGRILFRKVRVRVHSDDFVEDQA